MFRAFGEWMHGTFAAMIDGRQVLTMRPAIKLSQFTPIPVYDPASPQPWGVVDVTEFEDPPRWLCVGTFGRPYPKPGGPFGGRMGADRIGTHLPEDVAAEIIAWAESWVQANPTVPCIPRTEVAYRRNSYQTMKTVNYSYNRLKDEFDLSRNEFDPGFRGARGTGQNTPNGYRAANGDAGTRTPRTRGQQDRPHGTGRQTVAAFEGDRLHAVFHGYRSDDGDEAAG